MNDTPIDLAQFLAVVDELVGGALDLHAVSEGTHLTKNLGINSINLGALLLMCEERFGLSVFERASDIAALQTVGQMLALLKTCKAPSSP